MTVADADRARYHAAACIAANHLVALLGQVERVATPIGVPLEAYLALAQASFDDVGRRGPAAALTGPVARRDWDTVARHVAALPADERPAYLALARAAHRLVAEPGEAVPEWLAGARWGPARRAGDDGRRGHPSHHPRAARPPRRRPRPRPARRARPHHGLPARGPRVAHRPGRRRVRHRRHHRVREPAAVRRRRGPGVVPPRPRPRHRAGRGLGRRTWCSPPRWRRCTPPPCSPPCRSPR